MQRLSDCQIGVRLREILPDGHFFGAEDISVQACTSDPRQCQPGDTFVALSGLERDGHECAQEAVRRGASAVVAERLVPIPVPVCLVPDTREALGRISHRLAGQPGDRLRMIGISGTYGKTTTGHLLAAVLTAARQRVAVSTSLLRSGSSSPPGGLRETPNALELASWLAEQEASGATCAVVEASSQALAERRLAGLQLDAAVLTNVRREHLDFHGSLRNYRRAKRRLFEHLKGHGFAVLNADDPASRHLLGELDCPVITIARRETADISATIIERHSSEQTFLLSAGDETVPVRTRIIGDHHVTSCLAATAVGLVAGLPLTTIVRGLESVDRLPGRLERIECGQPFSVFVDAAATPDQLAVCLRTLRHVTSGRLICVYSGGDAHRPGDQRPLLGRVAERSADVGIITSGHNGGDFCHDTMHEILDGYERPARAHLIPSRCRAITWALEQARPGDTVLIAGHELPAGDRATVVGPTDDEFARRWLYGSALDEPAIIPFPAA